MTVPVARYLIPITDGQAALRDWVMMRGELLPQAMSARVGPQTRPSEVHEVLPAQGSKPSNAFSVT
jgi:hypothetical protein